MIKSQPNHSKTKNQVSNIKELHNFLFHNFYLFQKIMKKVFYFLALLAIACNNPKSDKQLDTLELAPLGVSTETKVAKLLRTIMGTGDGLLRDVNFGDPISDAKKVETSELFEEDADHVGYTFDTDNLETVDILYKNDRNQKITAIQIDVYMNSKKSNDSLFHEFENLFTIRYGKPVKDSLSATWKVKPVGTVSVKDVSKAKDKGLAVMFTQTTKSI